MPFIQDATGARKFLTLNGGPIRKYIPTLLSRGAAVLKILVSPSTKGISALVGTYRTHSPVQTHGAHHRVTLMELVHMAREVWHCQRQTTGARLGAGLWSSWFVGHVGKIFLNRVRGQDASQIVRSLFHRLIHFSRIFYLSRTLLLWLY